MRLLEEECKDLAARGAWQELINEVVFLSINAESQGTKAAGLGSPAQVVSDMRFMFPQIIWDRTQRLPILGAVNPQDWQALKAIIVSGPRFRFRWRGDALLINPVPPAAHSMAFEYVTKNWVLQAGTTPAAGFAGDTDVIRLPDEICLMGLRWRWKKEKGLAYAEDFNTYEAQVVNGLARNKAADLLRMDGETMRITPGIWVPAGNWFGMV
jgi:hypothetical protein